jgi:hypothetical protein
MPLKEEISPEQIHKDDYLTENNNNNNNNNNNQQA